ncbi:MAG TPA: metallophosphoesterase, partial [Actinomycetota bacterium]|nr:metallophosphoesterase [Actinomycetota bacterium]
MSGATVRRLLRLAVTTLVATMSLATPPAAWATERCGASDGHTLCVTVPDTDLTGEVAIGVTNTPNDGTVLATWVPSGKGTVPIPLITRTTPSPPANEYSFVWPTQKYLDASGVLRLQHTSATGPGSPVEVAVTLSNGNVDDFQHTPADWESFLPGPWNAPSDPVVAAVGDGPSARPAAHALAESIANADPDLFLFLGDIYEQGTFTENLNHYGRNAMDGGPGTLWGRLGRITQPTIGNHEADANVADWVDYFHGRPLYTSFRMGNVLFFDLATSETGMSPGSSQYEYVESVLTSPSNPPPPCIVAYMHKPPLSLDSINPERAEMWKLLMDHGGDLVLTGHVHSMIEYKPLNRDLQLPSP